ncbi:hypothetical protein PR048_032940 [Dryococelus australis]|uniref:Uncharacterized protein n=1 Tax=Dryococelus australis TaxID=614101 RepID=A0ABQ9G4F0_9NEOP|nr:hypothetical protein PR048_032940 [Dryococelus australis]
MEGERKWSNYYCNPYNKKEHWLRSVTENMVSLNYAIERHMKICTSQEKFSNPEDIGLQPGRSEETQPGSSILIHLHAALDH